MASVSQKSSFMAWFITSETPDCFEIITGILHCIASRGEIPNGSDTEGII